MVSWAYLKDGAGILPASNMADPLRGANLKPTDILVREAVQNSLDERRQDTDEPVRVSFTRLLLTGTRKAQFVEHLHLGDLAERRAHFPRSRRAFGANVFNTLDDPATVLPVLMISDFNANGLGGRWNRRGSRDDRFFNLVLSIGGSRKQDEDEAGDSIRPLGSYGYGKMAFAMSSEIRTVLYYSTFPPSAVTDGVRCRAMASSFLPEHSASEIDYAGQAYLGVPSLESQDRIPREPITNEAAHAWMQDLGLPIRDDADTGTTVVIPGANASVGEVARCCEMWWWPRMRDPSRIRRVNFQFTDENGSGVTCNPRSRTALGPFLDCYRIVASGQSDDLHALKDVKVKPQGQSRAAGKLAIKGLSANGAETEAVDNNNDEPPLNSIALVRDGLVVRYESSFAHEDKPPIAGVFVPDSKAETVRAFALSEPPSHDEWVENSDRLLDRFSWGGDFLRLTKNRLRLLARDFQTQLASLPNAERTPAAAFLQRLLAPLFRSPGTGHPVVPPVPAMRAFAISTVLACRRNDGTEDYGVFRIALSAHAGVPFAHARVSVSLAVLADANASPSDPVPCEVRTPDGVESDLDVVTFDLELHEGRSVDVEARARVHPLWRSQWKVTVERVQA